MIMWIVIYGTTVFYAWMYFYLEEWRRPLGYAIFWPIIFIKYLYRSLVDAIKYL